ncbi:MAG TPA: carboxypeptidase-like regulatory domain-containing protein, partial [Thermoplasmata archaeon]|nr:carboxypeptidase-like regulatory domain-containing protein [Thermoplasmata archaeon]
GLEVRDASYISVGPNDVVQAFPAYRSTTALVNGPPTPNGLTVNGFGDGTAGIAHILGASPTLAWRFRDPNAADLTQVQFNVSVSSVSPSRLVFWHNESSALTSLPYAGEPLVPGTSYVMQIVASDGRLWSSPTGVLFRVNTPPPAPALFAPADLARDVSRNPTLVWVPVADAESDPIHYWYWVSEDVGFADPISGTTDTSGASLSLAEGTTYYWKVAASDGYEVAGNATVWQFTTVTSVLPVRGEIRGRVVNASVPLAEAFVELLLNGTPVRGAFTAANGTFRFLDLDLQAYAVRVSAIGFRITTRAANPTQAFPVVDLLDISLERLPSGDGENPSSSLPFWAVLLIVALLVTTGATSALAAFLGRRRRKRQREEEDADAETEGEEKAEAVPKAAPSARSATRSDRPIAGVVPSRPAAPSVRGPKSPAPLMFECPNCGRAVGADATRCVCGAEFESSDAASSHA